MNRLAFLDQEAPEGYVAGSARGAVGFSTGIETVNSNSRSNNKSNKYKDQNNNNNVDDNDNSDVEFNNLDNDNEQGLLTSRRRDLEEEEEDRVYEEIERKLQAKRKASQLVKSPAVQESNLKRPQFNDLKRQLATLTEAEWELIPEAGDMTRKNKRQRILDQQLQRLYAAPDSILARVGGEFNGTNKIDGLGHIGASNVNLAANDKTHALKAQLDALFPVKNVQKNNVPSSIESLDLMDLAGAERDAKFADIKKGRLILASMRKSEPYKSSSWISSARLEEEAKCFDKARDLISQGCRTIPGNEEVWLENIRLNINDRQCAKAILKEALNFCNKSEKLWLKSFELENDDRLKKRTIMRALEYLPKSVELWKKLIDMETDEAMARKLLAKAVDLCPEEWEFWLGLINLSSYPEAKQYLNNARKALNSDIKVWLAACKLEEGEHSNIEQVKLCRLTNKAVTENRDLPQSQWFNAAIESFKEGFPKTSNALITSVLSSQRALIGVGAEAEENKINYLTSLIDEASGFIKQDEKEIALFIFDYIVDLSPGIHVWKKLLAAIKNSPSDNHNVLLLKYYQRAIECNPLNVDLYLAYSEDSIKIIGVDKAREILLDAYAKLDQKDAIKLAIVELEFNYGSLDKAKEFVSLIVHHEPTTSSKLWYKYIHILRCDSETPITLISEKCQQALGYFPKEWKIHLQYIQVLETSGDWDLARKAAVKATRLCPKVVNLWIALSKLEEKQNVLIRARSILDSAMLSIPNSPELAIAKVQLEKRQNNITAAQSLASKNVKQFPDVAFIWYQYLSMISKMSLRKPEFVNALQKTNNSAEMLMYIGVLFWQDGKFTKAKSWFEKSLAADENNGDAWGWLYNYVRQYGTKQEQEICIKNFDAKLKKTKGRIYNTINKDPKNYGKSTRELLSLVSVKLLEA